jgi:hypothetical protein
LEIFGEEEFWIVLVGKKENELYIARIHASNAKKVYYFKHSYDPIAGENVICD